MSGPVALLDEPDRLRVGLSPIRRRLLERLRQPASATQLASELAMGRQRVNYHLRALENAKLVDLVEERQRRGCVERILVARAQAFIVDPGVMTAKTGSHSSHPLAAPAVSRAVQDKFSAEHLIDAAADVVRDVTRMRVQAEKQGTRLLTFTMQTDISFAEPDDLERFTTAVAEFMAREAAKFHTPGGGRRYRVVVGGHPSPSAAASPSPLPSPRADSAGAPKQAAGESHHDRDRDTKEPRDDRPRAGRSARRRTH
jgi:DNA-binding transcriptional ArsR family regulator